MRYLLNKRLTKIIKGFVFIICVSGCSISHQEKAQQHILKALQEYEKSIIENPGDVSLQEKYYNLAKIGLGDTRAKAEIYLLYRTIGKDTQAHLLLQELASKDTTDVSRYFERKLDTAYNLSQRIHILEALTHLNPKNPSFFENLGRLYLGTGNTCQGIQALSKSVELGNRKEQTITYLVRAMVQNEKYDDAIHILNGLLSEKDNIKMRQQLAQLYKKQGKQELYLAEMERIKGKKQPLLAFKKPEIKRPVSEKKPEVPEKILLSQKIDIGPYNFLVVDKSLQSLIVYQFDGIEIRKILDVVCTTGKNMEDKKKPGDLATPEGTFLIRSFIPGEKLDPKYGAGAYVLDFPDYLSRRLDKDGSGIWLHGTPIERPPYNSEGCVVVNDSDFQKISEFIEPGKTYIHIVKQVKDVNISDMNLVWELVQEWKKSWENLETERYLSFYSEKFKSDGKDKKTWAEYKRRVNKNKRFVNIELSNSVLVPYGNTDFGYVFLLDTIQKYESNNLKSTTRKNLYLAKENGTYKIIGELVK
ncbi:MAG: L,D-transpeptidase family protein [Candidatus Omnitrophica bacterium]|nr:L,D-transpeptidase family protein [Candidatus Omnitrophota bacterium]